MKILEALIAWTPKRYEDDLSRPGIIVVPWPDKKRLSDSYMIPSGACDTDSHKLEKDKIEAMLFIDFHTITVRDGISPQAAHQEFLKIDEYRKLISPDTEGADQC